MEFVDRFGRAGMTPEELEKVISQGNEDIFDDMLAAMREHEKFRLIHGRFHSLADKLEMVRKWPGVTEKQIETALVESKDRVARFEKESPNNPLLNIVASVYLEDAPSTLIYARDRMRETLPDEFWQWDSAYAKGIDENRVRYLQDKDGNTVVPVYRNCVRIEVIDLAAHFNPTDGTVAKDVRGKDSAHFAVIYAAAQDPTWVRQIDGEKVPWVLACGLEFSVPGCDAWWYSPYVCWGGGEAGLNANHVGYRFRSTAMAVLRE